MKKALIFASYVPDKSLMWIVEEFFKIFEEHYSDYDIYVGVNPSCKEYIDYLEDKWVNDKICNYGNVQKHMVVNSDASAYQSALNVLKIRGDSYDHYVFVHTKGITSNAHQMRYHIFREFLTKNKQIEELFLKHDNIGTFSPWLTYTSTKGSINNLWDVLLPETKGKNTDLTPLYTFYAIKGKCVNYFIDNVIDDFWTKNLTTITYPYYKEYKLEEGLELGLSNEISNQWSLYNKKEIVDTPLDRYFFERDFPMVCERLGYSICNNLNC